MSVWKSVIGSFDVAITAAANVTDVLLGKFIQCAPHLVVRSWIVVTPARRPATLVNVPLASSDVKKPAPMEDANDCAVKPAILAPSNAPGHASITARVRPCAAYLAIEFLAASHVSKRCRVGTCVPASVAKLVFLDASSVTPAKCQPK